MNEGITKTIRIMPVAIVNTDTNSCDMTFPLKINKLGAPILVPYCYNSAAVLLRV